jgi:glucose/arabinose dehydrogenase
MAWLPDGALLVTEKSGILYHIKNGANNCKKTFQKYTHVDRVVCWHCATSDYAKNGWIYITYASDEGEGTGGNTKLIHAKLVDGGLTQIESLYKATIPQKDSILAPCFFW